jgi:hypothetical protein
MPLIGFCGILLVQGPIVCGGPSRPACLTAARPSPLPFLLRRSRTAVLAFVLSGAGGRAREALDLVSALVYLGDFS